MANPKSLNCYDYVNRPYERVRELLHRDPAKFLQRATASATKRANTLLTGLRVEAGGLQLGVDVRVIVRGVRDDRAAPGDDPITRVELSWEASRMPAVFPAMLAEVSARPLSATETQLAVDGSYWPPLGAIGATIDAAVGHRIAEATVHNFLSDIVDQIRQELP